MNRFFKFLDRLSQPLIINIVRRAMTVLIPMVLVASVAQALLAFPLPWFETWLENLLGGRVYTVLSYVRNFSFAYFSVMLAISISVSYILETREPIETAVFAPPAACVAFLLITRIDNGGDAGKLATQGSFWALIISLTATWMYFKLVNSKLGNILDISSGHDMFYRGAMRAFVPLLIIIVGSAFASFIIHDVLGIENLNKWLGESIGAVLDRINNSFLEMLASTFLIHLLWFFGIHGSNVLEPYMLTHTDVGPNIIFSKTFFDIFVLMGGCGTSVCIVAAIIFFSRHGKLKNLARSAALPVFLNINEMITFGLPIIWNPTLFIPFMLVPAEAAIIAYIAVASGICAPVISEVTWTTPIFLSGYTATGSISGAIVQLVIIGAGILTYLPFLRLNEEFYARRVKTHVSAITNEFRASEVSGEEITFIERNDSLGVTANMLMTDLKNAVKMRQPYLVYQPQFKADGTCIGAEALLRWRHPTAGHIYPPLIIYLAQKGGFLSELEEHIFDMACNAIKQTDAMTQKPFKISVNITARSLKWDGLEKCIDDAVERCGIEREKLWIEITERDILSKDKEYTEKMTRLRDRGHKFFIDDFGMGKTSVFYLQSGLFDGVKLDGAITRTILEDTASREIASSIIDLSNKLGMMVIAEFVESEEICNMLDELGCDCYQGYYFSKPVDISDFWERLN